MMIDPAGTGFDSPERWSTEFARNNKQLTHKNLRCFPCCSESGHVENGFCGQSVEFAVSRYPLASAAAAAISASSSSSSSSAVFSPPSAVHPELFAWAQFRQVVVDDERQGTGAAVRKRARGSAAGAEIQLGTELSMQALVHLTKDTRSAASSSKGTSSSSESTADKPLFEGAPVRHQRRTDAQVRFVFNAHRKGWNYNWRASKYSASMKHALFVYLFVAATGAAVSELEKRNLTCVGVYMSPVFELLSKKRASVALSRRETPEPPQHGNDDGDEHDEDYDAEEAAALWAIASSTVPPLPAQPVLSVGVDDEDDGDINAAAPITPEQTRLHAVIERRVELLLPRLYSRFTSGEKSPMDFFNAAAFSANSWFHRAAEESEDDGEEDEDFRMPPVSLLGGGGGDTTSTSNSPSPSTAMTTPPYSSSTSSPAAAPATNNAAADELIIAQLATYLLDENSLTAQVRGIVARNLTTERRRRAVVLAFYGEIKRFLQLHGYLEADLDLALTGKQQQQHAAATSDKNDGGDEDVHVAALVEQLTKVAIQENAAKQKVEVAAAVVSVPGDVDLSGYWRLDDVVLGALDECRQRRGVPQMVRQMVSSTETEFVLHHTVDKIVMGIKNSKLFSSTSEEFPLDGVEHVLERVLPIPWSNDQFPHETAVAWMDGRVAKQMRTYSGAVRTFMSMERVDAATIEMEIQYHERVVMSTSGPSWECRFSRRGLARRVQI